MSCATEVTFGVAGEIAVFAVFHTGGTGECFEVEELDNTQQFRQADLTVVIDIQAMVFTRIGKHQQVMFDETTCAAKRERFYESFRYARIAGLDFVQTQFTIRIGIQAGEIAEQGFEHSIGIFTLRSYTKRDGTISTSAFCVGILVIPFAGVAAGMGFAQTQDVKRTGGCPHDNPIVGQRLAVFVPLVCGKRVRKLGYVHTGTLAGFVDGLQGFGFERGAKGRLGIGFFAFALEIQVFFAIGKAVEVKVGFGREPFRVFFFPCATAPRCTQYQRQCESDASKKMRDSRVRQG